MGKVTDPHIVGRSVSVDHQPFTVVGVMPKEFDLGVTLGDSSAGLWMPFVYSPSDPVNRGWFSSFVARLKKGVTLSQAEAQMEAISARLAAEYPDQYPKALRGYGRMVTAGVSGRTDPRVRPALLILLGAVGFVLLMACVNVASLLVARSWTRQGSWRFAKRSGRAGCESSGSFCRKACCWRWRGARSVCVISVWGIRLLRVIGSAEHSASGLHPA